LARPRIPASFRLVYRRPLLATADNYDDRTSRVHGTNAFVVSAFVLIIKVLILKITYYVYSGRKIMKKIFIFLAAMMILPLANAAKFEEGVHYEVIAEQATAKPEVAEYFSYFCPHCNRFEPVMMDVTKRLEGSDIKVQKNHVSFIGRQMGEEMQKAFAASELL